MSDTEQMIRALYERGQVARDLQWRAYEMTLSHLMAHLEQGQRFIDAFGHLVPQPELTPEALQKAMDDVARAGDPPPPLPDPGETPDERDDAIRAWEQAIGKPHPTRRTLNGA